MNNSYLKPTPDMHRIVGEQLHAVKNALDVVGKLIAERYPKHHRVHQKEQKLNKVIGDLKLYLENEAVKENLDGDSDAVYRGRNRSAHVYSLDDLPPEMREDVTHLWVTEGQARNRFKIKPFTLRAWGDAGRVTRAQTRQGAWLYRPADIRRALEDEGGDHGTD